MRIYGNALAGGPLSVKGIDPPTSTVTHAPPVHVTPKPLPALATGSRDYQRRWALSHGMRVALVGALPKAVLDAYQEALR